MIPVLLIAVPLIAGLIGFLLKDRASRGWSLFASLLTLGISLIAVAMPEGSKELLVNVEWLTGLNSRFALRLDGLSGILCLLTTLSYPIIFIATWGEQYKKANNFF